MHQIFVRLVSSFSQRAENAYKQAQELVKSLDEADLAQQRAKDAIKQANEDISLAKSDLEQVNFLQLQQFVLLFRFWSILLYFVVFFVTVQIDGVTVEAQQKANETAATVDNLFENLNKLQKNVLKNEFDAKEIKAQSELVRDAANNAHDSAVKV